MTFKAELGFKPDLGSKLTQATSNATLLSQVFLGLSTKPWGFYGPQHFYQAHTLGASNGSLCPGAQVPSPPRQTLGPAQFPAPCCLAEGRPRADWPEAPLWLFLWTPVPQGGRQSCDIW